MRVVTERREGRAHDAFGEALVADRGDVIDAKTALPFRHEHIFAALLKTVHPAAGVLDDIGEFLERVRFARSLFVENQIGRASCRESEGQYVYSSVGAVYLKKKNN